MKPRIPLAIAVPAAMLIGTVAYAQQPLDPLPAPPPSTQPNPPPPPPPPATPPASSGDFGLPDQQPPPPPPPPHDPSVPTQPSNEELGRAYRPSFKGAGGFQYAQVHGVSYTGARIDLAVGGQNDNQGHYASLKIFFGSTAEGLNTYDVRASWHGDLYRASILRLGVDIEMGYLVIARTTLDRHLWALGIGGGVHASADIIQFGPRNDHALYAALKLDAHVLFGPAFMWGPSLSVGVRY